MATFQQVFYNISLGSILMVLSYLAFGFMVRQGYNATFAPRTGARPKEVIKNVLKAPYSLSWILWAYRLSYVDLMQGIPGTGTRQNGWSGPILKTNLDGVVMLKFHVLQMKVAAFATVLCLMLILPLNLTAECDDDVFGTDVCAPLANQSSFDRATIAHIPPLQYMRNDTNGTNVINSFKAPFRIPGTSGRYIVITLCFLAICYYACHLVYKEWISNLALRRIFYFEKDHYGDRMKELDEIVNLDVPEDPKQEDRAPWFPHPEFRETIPNVSLYSVLYRMPQGIKVNTDGKSKKTDLEHQLEATVEFFDACVPNQPGFSSSVAAATILPRADHTSLAWKKWYKLGLKLRLLHFLRVHIKKLEKKQGKIDGPDETVPLKSAEEGNAGDASMKEQAGEVSEAEPSAEVAGTDEGEKELKETSKREKAEAICDSEVAGENEILSTKSNEMSPDSLSNHSTSSPKEGGKGSSLLQFQYSNFDVEEWARSVGLSEFADVGIMISGMGIEQLNVLARESSQSVSKGCPLGWAREITIKYTTLEDLKAEEEETLAIIKELKVDLMAARERVNELSFGFTSQNHNVETGEERVGLSSKSEDGGDEFEAEGDMEEGITPSTHEQSSFLRQRVSTSQDWENAQRLATSMQWAPPDDSHKPISALEPTMKRLKIATSIKLKQSKQSVKSILDHTTYAVITFTSRQAAVAARQCLTDGGGLNRWEPVKEIPIAPLADGVSCCLCFCRSCCRPVAIEISDNERKWRKFFAFSIYIFFCFGYTVPLALVSTILNPEQLAEWFPESEALQNPDSFFFKILSGVSSGMLYSLFFSFCPQLFDAIVNFEGKATGRRKREERSIRLFWYFMLLTAFTGTFLTTMMYNYFKTGEDFGDELKRTLRAVAGTIPTQQAPVWLNWIVVRVVWSWPAFYLARFNPVLYTVIQWPWMSRIMRGGGPGGPPPYRIYVDAATVTMIITSMSPVCPVVAPFALLYFVIVIPILRWLLVFVYRPFWFDGGGTKWPVLHEMVISAITLGQILVWAMLFLRFAYFSGLVVLLSIIPTQIFNSYCKDRFLQPYKDAGLLQTSKLDGWDPSEPNPEEKREEYRRWLVDCHKASYVPTCLLGSNTFMTAEPAVVIPTNRRGDHKTTNPSAPVHKKAQPGAVYRRGFGGNQEDESDKSVPY